MMFFVEHKSVSDGDLGHVHLCSYMATNIEIATLVNRCSKR